MNIEKELRNILLDILDVEENELVPSANLADDLGVESVDMVDIVSACESRFRIRLDDEDLARLKTVQDVIEHLTEATRSKDDTN